MNTEVTEDTQEIEMIDPVKAMNWLETNKFENRRVDDRNVDKIARDIKNKKWIYDGNPIRFDTKGNVLDGQHRLWAIVKANRTVKSLVVRGLADEAVNVIDTGKTRSNADIMHFQGFVNTSTLAAVARLYFGYKEVGGDMNVWAGKPAQRRYTANELLAIVDKERKLIGAVSETASFSVTNKMLGRSTAAFCFYLFDRSDYLMAGNFYHKFEKGNDLQEGSPILVLKNALMIRETQFKDMGARGGNRAQAHKIAIIIKAWNAFKNGKTISRLRYDPEKEAYPQPA